MELPLFSDPLRNGTLLLKVIRHLGIGKEIATVPCACPKNVEDCKKNIRAAIQALKTAKIRFPDHLLSLEQAEEIVRGNFNAIWSYYYHLRLHHINEYFELPEQQLNAATRPGQDRPTQKMKSSASKPARAQVAASYTNPLPYTAAQIDELQQSTVQWLRAMSPEVGRCWQTYEQIEPRIRNGSLLCEVVSQLLRAPIQKIHRNPTTKHNCLANINKALEELRNNDAVG